MFSSLLVALSWLSATSTANFVPDVYPDSTWDLNIGPSQNDTANLVFNTVHSLLMGWPNRRYRNGHAVVPGIIPTGTFLYHGRGDPVVPATPEWTALDFELSTLYCGLFSTDNKGCWHLTLAVERPLRVLYFDGYSGLKLPGSGTLDSQDVLAWGKVMPDRYRDEPQRINDLCTWGHSFGIDGFVRLHTSYEVMLCDFSAGLKVESKLHINVPYLPPSPSCSFHPNSSCQNTPAPGMKLGIPLDTFGMGELLASKRVDDYPGETRVQLHLHRLVSFYDISLVPSLVSQRFGQHRLQHRILGINHSDIGTVQHRVQRELAPHKWTSPSHSIDWSSLFHTIVQRYAARLESIRFDLNSTDRSSAGLSTALRATFLQLRAMLQPYDLVAARPAVDGVSQDISWATVVYKTCVTVHPKFISNSAKLTSSEKLLLYALEVTNREICRTLTKMWAYGMNHRMDTPLSNGSATITPLKTIHERWKQEVDALMLWLDWSVWLKCNPACNPDEMCYLPISPYLVPGADPADDWITQARDPQPTCIPRHSR
ncbi:hypothetical protein GGU10DRAFT_361639 [Lentinula aff. detonsa]|uniref:Uncharacterized protein n=1 Tax=Lentinula aff. detonsa TaxID=2804958 RepID=A0AA38NKJ1_9AGAR|nr:hypothetical protein GGU10DRAFT_361639 [Lentinula aff. detonsa]